MDKLSHVDVAIAVEIHDVEEAFAYDPWKGRICQEGNSVNSLLLGV